MISYFSPGLFRQTGDLVAILPKFYPLHRSDRGGTIYEVSRKKYGTYTSLFPYTTVLMSSNPENSPWKNK